jgi:hypothetical protein
VTDAEKSEFVRVKGGGTNVWSAEPYRECFFKVAKGSSADGRDVFYLAVNGMIDSRSYRADFYLVELSPQVKEIVRLDGVVAEGGKLLPLEAGGFILELPLLLPMTDHMDLVERPLFSIQVRATKGRFELVKERESSSAALTIKGEPAAEVNHKVWEALALLAYHSGLAEAERQFKKANLNRTDSAQIWKSFAEQLISETPLKGVQQLTANRHAR